jgi:hypothetical protein
MIYGVIAHDACLYEYNLLRTAEKLMKLGMDIMLLKSSLKSYILIACRC